MDERFERLKQELFICGIDAIEDFLGYEVGDHEEKDVIDRRMDEVYQQMPDEILCTFYKEHNIM